MISFEDVRRSEEVNIYIKQADMSLAALGFTEHSFAHVLKVAKTAGYILGVMNAEERDIELVKIAAYLHDIGNVINRVDHSQSGGVMAFRILSNMGMEPQETAKIICAIGNHDEGTGVPVDALSAALILADKSDVRRSRVRNKEMAAFDIHDRVNYSVTDSKLAIDKNAGRVTLELTVDTDFGSVFDYFEIFMSRMLLCRKAARFFELEFCLIINGQQLM